VPQNKKPSTEELLEASALLAKISAIDLDKLDVERYEALRPVDRLIEDLQSDKKVREWKVKPKKKTKPHRHSPKCKGNCRNRCGSGHWTAKRKKERDYSKSRRGYLRNWRADKIRTAKGMYSLVVLDWRKKGKPFLSLEEWETVLYPLLDGRVPSFTRYDTEEGFTLENTVMADLDTGNIIFDGKEYILRKLGYIL
jgi:hypothetical protein